MRKIFFVYRERRVANYLFVIVSNRMQWLTIVSNSRQLTTIVSHCRPLRTIANGLYSNPIHLATIVSNSLQLTAMVDDCRQSLTICPQKLALFPSYYAKMKPSHNPYHQSRISMIGILTRFHFCVLCVNY